jgi:hypothetical protein
MPLTITAAGTGNSATSTATLAFDCGASFAVGDRIVVVAASDNAGTSGARSMTTCADVKGHTYLLLNDNLRDPGAASAGCHLRTWIATVTSAMVTTDDITISFSPNTTSKAAAVWKVVHDTSIGETGVTLVTYADGTGASNTTFSLTASALQAGYTMIGAAAIERLGTITADTDTDRGSWSSAQTVVGSTGTTGTSMTVTTQFKTVTTQGDQTYSPSWTTAADYAQGYIVIAPTNPTRIPERYVRSRLLAASRMRSHW